jgi:hypothetical protein
MIKNIIILLLWVSSINSFGQLCSNYIANEYNKKENWPYKISTPLMIESTLNNPAFSLFFMIYIPDQSISWVIDIYEENICIPARNKIHLIFGDKSILQLDTYGDKNCNGHSFVSFSQVSTYEEWLVILKSLPLKGIGIETEKGFCDKYFTPTQSRDLITSLECLIELGKIEKQKNK